jgi:hypothetical protein
VTTLDAGTETLSDTDLREWVRVHRVCRETATHRDRDAGGVHPVGYDVILVARCVGDGPWDPAGARAVEIFERLNQLAVASMPAPCRESIEVAPFEAAFHMRARSGWAPEVRLVIEIRHGHDYFSAIDDRERTCVGRVERALDARGVQAGSWVEPLKPHA